MLTMIVSHTPPWVWVLLAALLALGLWQTRTRRMTRVRLLALPLTLLALGLWSMAPGFAALPLAALPWALATAGAALLALRLPPPAGSRWLAGEQRLLRPGSWLPLWVIVASFSLRYAMAVALALHPAWRSQPLLQLPAALLFGAIGGALLGRALALLKLTMAADGPLPA